MVHTNKIDKKMKDVSKKYKAMAKRHGIEDDIKKGVTILAQDRQICGYTNRTVSENIKEGI